MPENTQKLLLEIADRLDSIKRTRGEVPFYQLPPFEFDKSVPPVTEVEKLSESQDIGVTHLALRFIRPTDNNIDHFEIWAKNVSFGSDQPYKVADVIDSPASISLKADSATNIVLFIRTIMKNGLATDLNSSPTIATSVATDPAIIAGDLAPGSVGDSKLDRVTDAISILNADILNLNAAKLNAGFMAAARLDVGVVYISAGAMIANAIIDNAKINDLAAAKILAGTMIAVNLSAGTFELVSTPNTMKINGTDGFLQTETVTLDFVKIKGGVITVSNTSAFPRKIEIEDSIVRGTEPSGNLVFTLGTFSDEFGKLELMREGTTNIILTANGGMGQADSGFGSFENSSSTVRVDVGTDSNDRGKSRWWSGSTEEVTINANAAANSKDSLVIRNSSGTNRCKLGVAASGAQAGLDLFGTNNITLDTTSGNGLFIGGNRVVTTRQTDPGASPTTEELRQVLLNHGLI